MSIGRESGDAEKLGLPITSFLYTIDQICQLVGMDQEQALRTIFYFHNRSTGRQSQHTMLARDVAPPNDNPEWRVAEREFVRWLRLKGFVIDQRLTIRR